MSKNASKKTPARTAEAAGPPPSNPLTFALGLLFVLVAVAASLMMVIKHFDVMGLPGCGVDSGCDRAAKSVWGTVPLIKLPTSSLGLAYFAAVAMGWLLSRGRVDAAFKWLVRLGVLASVGFLAIIAIEKHFCIYCLAAHGGNLAFWIMVESAASMKRAERGAMTAIISAAAVFIGGIIGLGAIEWQHRQAVIKKAEGELAESTQRIIEQSGAQNDPTQAGLHTPSGGFTGRWLWGPENAPIRVVMFSDYQCKDCNAIEKQVREVMSKRNDVSISAKHFPLNADCNQHTTRTIHPNACWAARAAETAGILYGNDGFWKMHHWLFDRGGAFTNAELNAGLRQLGFDVQQFVATMNSDAALQPIRDDVDEGYSLGLFFTPMIFINGVELRGFYGDPTAFVRAIDRVAATNPKPGSPTQDRPPLASRKAVGDWREGTTRALPPKQGEHARGPADAPISIWVWGDYQNAHSLELDQYIRSVLPTRTDVRYIYRHYPMDQACNPNMQQTFSSEGCWAAKAAEAAAIVGGEEAFWKMHDWLYANQSNFTDGALSIALPQLGIDADAFKESMNSPQVSNAVATDIGSGKIMIPQGVPTIYVNGKWVARWKLGEVNILELILDEQKMK